MLYNFDNLSFQILGVNEYSYENGAFDVKGRPYAAISFRLSGSDVFEIGDQHLHPNPGDILFIPAHTPYRVEYSACKMIAVHLLDCNYTTPEIITPNDKRLLTSRFLGLLNAWRDRHNINQAKAYVFDILSLLGDEAEALPGDSEFAPYLQYLQTHYTDPQCTVEQICEQMHISRSGLQRSFQKHLGMTAKAYILKLRIQKALDMLTSGQHTVKAVAHSCGFEDEKYFSRIFKQTCGYPPHQFKQK